MTRTAPWQALFCLGELHAAALHACRGGVGAWGGAGIAWTLMWRNPQLKVSEAFDALEVLLAGWPAKSLHGHAAHWVLPAWRDCRCALLAERTTLSRNLASPPQRTSH